MDQKQASVVDALAVIERRRGHGFGAREVLGRQVFVVAATAPMRLDDRTGSGHVPQRARGLVVAAWQADCWRLVTGGSTQRLHTAAAPGDTVLFAANVREAARARALATGATLAIVPVMIDEEPDVEHGVAPPSPTETLDAHRVRGGRGGGDIGGATLRWAA